MSIPRIRTVAATLLSTLVLAAGCTSEDAGDNDCLPEDFDCPDDDSGKADGARSFKLNPGSEDLAACAGDLSCYLGSVDLTNAYWLGAVSKAIYATKLDADHPGDALGAMKSNKEVLFPGKKGGLEKAGLRWRELVVFDDNLAKSTAMYFETTDGVAVLAFRGTATDEGPANLVADANVGQSCVVADGTQYCIHNGFRDQFFHLWSSAAPWPRYVPTTFCAAGTDIHREGAETTHCTDVPPTDKVVVRVEMQAYLTERFRSASKPHTLFITGHSLGGALATLAVNELLRMEPGMLPANVAVYTYGTPRVGNEAFAQRVFEAAHARNIPYYRFVHRRDGVARVRLPSYAHLGASPGDVLDGLETLIHLVGADERFGETGPTVTLGRFDAQDPGTTADLLGDHPMSKYIAVLRRAKLPTR